MFQSLLRRKPAESHRRAPIRFRPTVEGLEYRLTPSTSAIVSNFNGTNIGAGSSIWFNSVMKVSGLGASPVEIRVVNASVDFLAGGQSYHVAVPDAHILFSPSTTQASTSFDSGNFWLTTLPMNSGGNVFLSGATLELPAGLKGGANPVTWTGDFQTDTPGVKINWQWGAAVYTTFSSGYDALNVKPVDSNSLSVFQNSDHAGTPETFKSFVVGGARGGGGSNWTGSYSATKSIVPDVVDFTPPPPPSSLSSLPASLSGHVFADTNGNGQFDAGEGLGSVVVTLTGTDAQGAVFLTATTDGDGYYHFDDLAAGTYTLTQDVSTAPGYQNSASLPGTLGGNPHNTDGIIDSIGLGQGQYGFDYDFADVIAGLS